MQTKGAWEVPALEFAERPWLSLNMAVMHSRLQRTLPGALKLVRLLTIPKLILALFGEGSGL